MRCADDTGAKPAIITSLWAYAARPRRRDGPGFIRIDSAHPGDQDGVKGLYHVNAVDCITQFEIVATCERLVKLVNHVAKGITDKDFALARKIEEVVMWQPGAEAESPLEGTPDDARFKYIKYD